MKRDANGCMDGTTAIGGDDFIAPPYLVEWVRATLSHQIARVRRAALCASDSTRIVRNIVGFLFVLPDLPLQKH